MSLLDHCCHVYTLTEGARLNTGIIWLRGKLLVLVLAAYDMLVLLC